MATTELMSDDEKKSGASQKAEKANYAKPVDVIDGVPDRSGSPRLWKYLAVAAVFVAWICFLAVCGITGTL